MGPGIAWSFATSPFDVRVMLGSTIRAADLEPCENQGADYSVIREMQRNIIFSYVFRRYSPVQFRMKTECLYLPFFSICKRLQSACLRQSACSCERTIFCLDRTPLLPTHLVFRGLFQRCSDRFLAGFWLRRIKDTDG